MNMLRMKAKKEQDKRAKKYKSEQRYIMEYLTTILYQKKILDNTRIDPKDNPFQLTVYRPRNHM